MFIKATDKLPPLKKIFFAKVGTSGMSSIHYTALRRIDGTVYEREYPKERFTIPSAMLEWLDESLPDIYAGELNTKRIKAYMEVKGEFGLNETTISHIFCKGADWYKSLLENKK